MNKGVVEAAASHPVSTGVATAMAGIPVVDLLDLASNVTTLIAGCMGIAVSYFFIQYHRSNIKLNEYRIKKILEEQDEDD